MKLLLLFILPILIISTPIICQIILSNKALKKSNVRRLNMINIGFVLLGLVTPIFATVISTYGIDESDCATGVGVFFIFGYFLAIISFFIALIFIISAYQMRHINKKSQA